MDRAKAVGGGALKVTFGALAIVGSGIGTWFSGGTLTVPMAATAGFGANTALSGVADIISGTDGDFDKVGEFNLIKDSVQYGVEKVADLLTDNEQKISTSVDATGLVIDGADLLTGAYGVSKGFDTIFNQSSKLVTFASNTMKNITTKFGNGTIKVPKVSNAAKAVATADVTFTLNSMYENASEKVKTFLEDLF